MIPIQLNQRCALVTGGSGGLGHSISSFLARAGAKVAVHYHDNEQKTAEALVTAITKKGKQAQAFKADISYQTQVERMFREIESVFGGVDILINNAGIDGPRAAVGSDDSKAWEKVVSIDLMGAYYCARAAIPHMKRVKNGIIINITSVHEYIPWSGYSAYASAKAGLSMFTKTLAQETSSLGIRVVAIAPGAIKTPINEVVWSDPQKLKGLDQKISMGRIGKPEEIGSVVVFLASDLASYITGTTLAVDGGMLLYPEFRQDG